MQKSVEACCEASLGTNQPVLSLWPAINAVSNTPISIPKAPPETSPSVPAKSLNAKNIDGTIIGP